MKIIIKNLFKFIYNKFTFIVSLKLFVQHSIKKYPSTFRFQKIYLWGIFTSSIWDISLLWKATNALFVRLSDACRDKSPKPCGGNKGSIVNNWITNFIIPIEYNSTASWNWHIYHNVLGFSWTYWNRRINDTLNLIYNKLPLNKTVIYYHNVPIETNIWFWRRIETSFYCTLIHASVCVSVKHNITHNNSKNMTYHEYKCQKGIIINKLPYVWNIAL